MFCKVPWFALELEGSNVSCARRLKSESAEDRFGHGRNTKQNRNQWFSAHFHCFDLLTCSDNAARNVGFVATQITLLRNTLCGRVNAWHC